MKNIENKVFEGERSLFKAEGLRIVGCTFQNGESPLKESRNIELISSRFSWKYPLWYAKGVTVRGAVLDETARSGIWYTHGIDMEGCEINAPKTFRRASKIRLKDCNMPNALESMWGCADVTLENVRITGDYFGMNCNGVNAKNLYVLGNYVFDGASNVVVEDAQLISKDSFWNCENVVVRNSYIDGEYIGWNSKNLTFINCKIRSNQGFCYIDNLKLVNCELWQTDLAFEYSTVDADINSHVDSIKNPISGTIRAKSIGQLILEQDMVDTAKTTVITEGDCNE